MSSWNALLNWLSAVGIGETENDSTSLFEDAGCAVNPATGLPMTKMAGGCGGVDTAGNPYGVDLSSHHGCSLGEMDSDCDWPDISDPSDPCPPWSD